MEKKFTSDWFSHNDFKWNIYLEKFKNNSVSDRAIVKVLSGFKHDEVSSTFVRAARKEGRIDSLPIHPKVLKIIKDNNLFADTAAKQAQGTEQSQSMLSNVWKKIKEIFNRKIFFI